MYEELRKLAAAEDGAGAARPDPAGHREQLFSLDFSPDGNRLLSGGVDQMVKLWDWRSGRELLSLKGPNVITVARFAPDGRKIVAGGWFDHGLLWEAATPEQVSAWETEEATGTQEFFRGRNRAGRGADTRRGPASSARP